jgi:hypothetical protein
MRAWKRGDSERVKQEDILVLVMRVQFILKEIL